LKAGARSWPISAWKVVVFNREGRPTFETEDRN
jgi:hypothetical protein